MYMTLAFFIAYFTLHIHACNSGADGCDHPGNFTGTLTPFANPATAYCFPGNETFIYASIPASFYNPPDESPCSAPINVTNPSTKKTIEAIVIGKCKTCAKDDIQLTTAGLEALALGGFVTMAPRKVEWTFD